MANNNKKDLMNEAVENKEVENKETTTKKETVKDEATKKIKIVKEEKEEKEVTEDSADPVEEVEVETEKKGFFRNLSEKTKKRMKAVGTHLLAAGAGAGVTYLVMKYVNKDDEVMENDIFDDTDDYMDNDEC
ncbi:MAG TPA: hypothetical protein PKK61_07565 [Defluviitaleaceae bacterium]|nr:hypothetical protein [Defluviitaleaceae bacterium]